MQKEVGAEGGGALPPQPGWWGLAATVWPCVGLSGVLLGGISSCSVLQKKQDLRSSQVRKAVALRHCCISPTRVPCV